MQLSDRSILRLSLRPQSYRPGWTQPLVTPFERRRLQPGSYDCTLGPVLLLPHVQGGRIDLREPRVREDTVIDIRQTVSHEYVLRPGGFILASTQQRFCLPDRVQGRFDGRSSLGRDGLLVHITAAVFDVGFEGVAVVELKNVSETDSWVLYEHMPIGQMTFTWLDGVPRQLYGRKNHYQHQSTTLPGHTKVFA